MNPGKLLAPLGFVYGRLMDVRNAMYDRGVLRTHSLGARTISIGNLTTGGTGKTPLVALTSRILADQGERVCVLTRGYGRRNENERVLVSDGNEVLADAETGGDEPVELAMTLIGKAAVIADADRLAAAKWAKERFDPTAFVLDDGFQHRRAKRNLDIVCIDATNPCGNGRILPAGTLRESFKALDRADIVVVTRSNLVDSTEALVERIRRQAPESSILLSSAKISGLVKLKAVNSAQMHPSADRNYVEGRSLAFCGLGNPENFKMQLEVDGYEIAGIKAFGDHHRYTQSDIALLEKEAAEMSAESLITTAKDAVKLTGLYSDIPIFVAELQIELNDESAFRELVLG